MYRKLTHETAQINKLACEMLHHDRGLNTENLVCDFLKPKRIKIVCLTKL